MAKKSQQKMEDTKYHRNHDSIADDDRYCTHCRHCKVTSYSITFEAIAPLVTSRLPQIAAKMNAVKDRKSECAIATWLYIIEKYDSFIFLGVSSSRNLTLTRSIDRSVQCS